MSSPLDSLPDRIEPIAPVPEAFNAPVQIIAAPEEKPFPAWSGWDVLAIAVFSIFCLVLFLILAPFVSGALGGLRHVSVAAMMGDARLIRAFLIAQAVAYVVIVGCMFLVVRSRTSAGFGEAIEWNWPSASAPAFLVGGVVLALAVDAISRFLPIPKSLPIEDLFNNTTNAYFLSIFGLTLAPLLEELFFRGLLYPVLRRRMGVLIAVLLTALGFAAIHSVQLGYAWAPLLSIFVVGVVFTLVRQRSSSVAASFLMHCGYNFTLFGLLWVATDHFRHLEKLAGQ